MIIFSEKYETKDFIVYKSEEYGEVGDYSVIHVRKKSYLADNGDLILMTKEFYDNLHRVEDD